MCHKAVKKRSESSLEKSLKKQVEKRGGICRKLQHSNDGDPDRLVLMPNALMYFVEMKREGETADTLQASRLRRLRELGYAAVVVAGPGELEAFVRRLDADQQSYTLLNSLGNVINLHKA